MQFNRDGLDIPDELVRCQKQGNVVFLCGAGVSVDSGMPNFDGLKRYVIDELKADDAPDAPFDELFSWLENKYGRTRIDNIIAQRLTAADHTPTDHHKIIAKLSRGVDGKAQIVTTNFDVLFEKAARGAKTYEPPTMPHVRWNASISGITYLHGKLNSTKYVLSRKDFSKAYIVEGWAAEFMRELIGKYTVVLCGYSAEDPIIKYFFEGLEGERYSNLWAFDSFEQEEQKREIGEKWGKMSTTPILYRKDKGHTLLWNALKAWAQFKPNDVKKKYLSSPKELEPYERAQVCYMVKDVVEAEDFANLDPSPHPDWIDVFDENGLLQWIEGDDQTIHGFHLSGNRFLTAIPARLFHLSHWIRKNLTSPTIVHWLMENLHHLHPRLIDILSMYVTEAKDMPSSFYKFWGLLFTYYHCTDRILADYLSVDKLIALPQSEEKIDWDKLLSDKTLPLDRTNKIFRGKSIENFNKVKENLSDWIERLTEPPEKPDTRKAIARIVGEDNNHQALMNIPLAQVIDKARETDRKTVWGEDETNELRPFAGLVWNEPQRAIEALELASRKNEYHIPFWEDAINRWNYDETTPRVTRLFHEHLRRLPAHVIRHLMQFTLGGWFRDRLPQIAQQDEQYALAIFDDLLKHFLTAPPKQAESSLLNDDGDTNSPPRILLNHAINSHFGHITEGLLKIFSAEERKEKSGIPSEFARRFEQLLQAPGDGSYHVACILAQNSLYLHYIDPDWTSEHLFPLFQLTNKWSQSAWDGILRSGNLPSPDVFSHLKPQFLKLFNQMEKWGWKDSDDHAYDSACQWVSVLCFHYEQAGIFSYQDAATCLKRVSPSGIFHALSAFGDVKEYPEFVLEFIKQALPKELSRQNETTMGAFIHILEKSGAHFPQLLEAVKGFLGEMKSPHLYRFYEDDNGNPIAKRFPGETLQLLDIIVGSDPHDVPWSLSDILALIIESEPYLADDRRSIRLRNLVARR